MSDLASFDSKQLRNALGAFPTGVTIVTTRDAEGKLHGVTANSFSSVSLDPPLVLWSQALTSKSYPAFRDSGHFAVNILAEDQLVLSNHFARSVPDKFTGIEHSLGMGDVPVLPGSAAHLECTKVATYPGGDHVVYLGRVERISHSGRRALAFAGGRYAVAYAHDLGPLSLRLGKIAPVPVQAVRIASDALPRLCRMVGDHTLCLAVWGNHGPTAIRWEASRLPVSENLPTGLVMSVTQSATGHAFAAFLPPEATRPLVEEELRSAAGARPDAAQLFEAEVAETRRCGVARVADAEASPLHMAATTAFSAPVTDADGAMVMALSMVSPASRLDPDRDGPALRALQAAARDLSARIGS